MFLCFVYTICVCVCDSYIRFVFVFVLRIYVYTICVCASYIPEYTDYSFARMRPLRPLNLSFDFELLQETAFAALEQRPGDRTARFNSGHRLAYTRLGRL